MVRISQSNDTWTVTAVQLAGSVNRKEVLRHEHKISDTESEEMLAALGEFRLWNRRDLAWNSDVHDGALWVIEGRRGTGYHPVFLGNVDEEAVRKLAVVFLRIADIRPSVLRGGE